MSSESVPEIQLGSLIGEEAKQARRPMVVLSAVSLAVGTGLVELKTVSAAGLSVKLSDNALPLIFGMSTFYLLCSFLAYSFIDRQRYRARLASSQLNEAGAIHQAAMRGFEQIDRHRTLKSQAEALTKDKKGQIQHQLDQLVRERECVAADFEMLRDAGEQGSRFTQHAHEHRMLRGDLGVLERRIRLLDSEMRSLKGGDEGGDSAFDDQEYKRYIEQVEVSTSRLKAIGSSGAMTAGKRLRLLFDFILPVIVAISALASLLVGSP